MTAIASAAVLRARVFASSYRDSVELMRIASELERLPGITRAGLVMGTPANRAVLQEAGLLSAVPDSAGANDLIAAVAGSDPASAEEALERAAALLTTPTADVSGAREAFVPTTLAEALSLGPANLAMISTPGTYATAEALKALKRGLHVFLFSDNISVQDEIELKTLAAKKHLLLMGPDCGTAIIDGVPLGFTNAVARGSVGLIGASGTGLQQVTCLIDRLGAGVSQAIGVGGRDLDERVGGAMMLAALDLLAADPGTSVIVLLSKPPAPAVAERVLAKARAAGKPVVVNFLGSDASLVRSAGLISAVTLEDAARAAVAVTRGAAPMAVDDGSSSELSPVAAAEAAKLAKGQRSVRGLYSGGSLAYEAKVILKLELGDGAKGSTVIDLGDDEYTVGRPHPMIDPRLRNEHVVALGSDVEAAVLLLDVVIGNASHPDPAGALAPAIAQARETAKRAGRYLAVVASVCGTDRDAQGLAAQESTLVTAGALVQPSNARAARLAALIAKAARR
jgi:succinyl-CoA synthetase alpha subunit